MKKSLLLVLLALLTAGCATTPPPPTVDYVELERFMGDWYVIAGLFTPFEKDAYAAVENYRLDEKGRIPTTFTFRKGSFDGPEKTYTSMAFVHDTDTYAEWRIQFFWPLRFGYRIIYLDDNYTATAVATNNRKYLWIMSRTPQMPKTLYDDIINLVTEQGFAVEDIVTVPQ
jgi:apolipoprotein D and lipocalin family protein